MIIAHIYSYVIETIISKCYFQEMLRVKGKQHSRIYRFIKCFLKYEHFLIRYLLIADARKAVKSFLHNLVTNYIRLTHIKWS